MRLIVQIHFLGKGKMKLPAASNGVSFCMQKSISWQATRNLTLACY